MARICERRFFRVFATSVTSRAAAFSSNIGMPMESSSGFPRSPERRTPALAAKHVTRTVPIVFAAVADPVTSGLIVGDANPSSGYVRMFQTLRSQSGADIKIFSTVEDAYCWLKLE